jgi:hypothetical protein
MKYQIYKICFLTILLLFSCNRKDESEKILNKKPPKAIKKNSNGFLNAFGKAKIGMSIKEFNTVFKDNLKDTILTQHNVKNGSLMMGFKELDVEDNIKLIGAAVHFRKGKLRMIGCNLNKSLIKQLEKKYGADLMKKKFTTFPSDSITIDFVHDSFGMSISAIRFHF